MSNYPLFIKGKTNQVYVRFQYNKVYNYAIYYHFYDAKTYINPLLTDESENFKLFKRTWPNLKQLGYGLRLKVIKLSYKALCYVLRSYRDESIKWLDETIAHQKRVFYSVPQPSSVKQKFEDSRSSK